MHSNKSLTPEEFEAVKPLLSKRANVDALYAVMVEGQKQADVARKVGVTRKAISQGVGKVWALHIEHGARPDGWEIVNVALPADLAEVVRDMALKARAKLGKKNGQSHDEDLGRC